MRLTPLSLLLTVQISAWCVLGTWVHGWKLLCYPAAWVVIAAFFYVLNGWHDRKQAALTAANVTRIQHAAPEHGRQHHHFEPAAADNVSVA